jgi:hypothetical protein
MVRPPIVVPAITAFAVADGVIARLAEARMVQNIGRISTNLQLTHLFQILRQQNQEAGISGYVTP